MLRFLFPLAAEVERDSETLRKLREETILAIAAGQRHHVAKSVAFGEWDNVVKVDRFLEDVKAKIFLERTHIDVCKPDEFFPDPISLVTAFI